MSSACEECGLDPERLTVDEAAEIIAGVGPRYRAAFAVVADDRDRLRAKPDPDVWSPLEYVVHLRDSVRYHGALTNRALKEDRPEFAAPDPDAIAQHQSYNDADPEEVLDSLEQQTTRFADAGPAPGRRRPRSGRGPRRQRDHGALHDRQRRPRRPPPSSGRAAAARVAPIGSGQSLPMWNGRTLVLRPAKSSPLAFSSASMVQMPSVSACVAGVQFSTICA